MKYEIRMGIRSQAIEHGHRPQTYSFIADVVNGIAGGYGIASADYPLDAYVEVDLPDEIRHSALYAWDIAMPGRDSRSGTADLCFVVCGATAVQDCNYYGELKGRELIQRALASGLYLIYPDQRGEMQRMPVLHGEPRWIDRSHR